jgi:hypothetical protein
MIAGNTHNTGVNRYARHFFGFANGVDNRLSRVFDIDDQTLFNALGWGNPVAFNYRFQRFRIDFSDNGTDFRRTDIKTGHDLIL